jgi:ethanolamine permease
MLGRPARHQPVDHDYFAKRGLRRYAGVASLWFGMGAERGGSVISGKLLNMAVAGAMLSYLLQAVSFIVLRHRLPYLARPYRSPLGVPGAVVTIVIAITTIVFQLLDPVFVSGVIGVGLWFPTGRAD